MYTLGGFNGSLRVRSVEVYEPFKDQWTISVSMEARRSTLGWWEVCGVLISIIILYY